MIDELVCRHLAKDEMESITEDKWDEDIWGLEHEDPASMVEIPKLIFFFGENVCLPFRPPHLSSS
jgi:hypothetical protein